MMAIPQAALSTSFEQALRGRRLHSAVFTTFQLDPEFFELEILSVFLDIPLSHAQRIRAVQLEQALQAVPGEIAVYYDVKGLLPGGGPAKLDVRRIGVRHTAVFHPKNVFLLVEEMPSDASQPPIRSLLVASLSANLTRSGWWENVEICHIEELTAGEPSRLGPDLSKFLRRVRSLSPPQEHKAMDEVLDFLRKLPFRERRKQDGVISTHFYGGDQSVTEMLKATAGSELRGANLEIISPYFDQGEDCRPLKELIAQFKPKEVRVCLPMARNGAVGCSEAMYRAVCQLGESADVHWSRLPKDMLKLGKSEAAADRFVHAKVYRFFTQKPKAEYIFCGSVNLTQAAHQLGGNVESGFFVQTPAKGPMEFWTSRIEKTPKHFDPAAGEDKQAMGTGSKLSLRYHWDKDSAEAHWNAKQPGGRLELKSATGRLIGVVAALPPGEWTVLDAELTKQFRAVLPETSLFEVHGETDLPLLVLVQEEGMQQKPSILSQLSPSDILRYWSMLSLEQRAAFIEISGIAQGLSAESLFAATVRPPADTVNLFDRVAGIFHAFGCLERAVFKALDDKKHKEATFRIFGSKYDSLGGLLDKVLALDKQDPVDGFLIFLCARQLCDEIKGRYPDFWQSDRKSAKALEDRLRHADRLRQTLLARNEPGFAEFLPWFERKFLARAVPGDAHGH